MNQFAYALTAAVLVLGLSCTASNKDLGSNTIHNLVVGKPKTIDPAHDSDYYSGQMIAMTYEGLLEYHYLKRPYQLVPALADGMPKVSRDAKTYTFKIKKGVLFQDDVCFPEGKGRELVAQDFVYSFKRLADPKEASPGWWILDGVIVGLNEWREQAKKSGKADYAKSIAGLRVLDKYTLQIELVRPSYQFMYKLAMRSTYAVPHEAVKHYKKDLARNPVGTGPYRLVREKSNMSSKLIWERNPTYRKALYPMEGAPGDREKGLLADAGKPLPFADKVITRVITESQPQWLSFLAGEVDLSGLPKDNFSQAISVGKGLSDEMKAKGIGLQTEPLLDMVHLTFNMEDSLLGKNKYLRQAMSMAFNLEPFIELFYNGRAVRGEGPIPPGLAGYDPKMVNPYNQHSVEKAKKLLAKAGFPEGKGLPTISLSGMAGTTERQNGDYFKQSMAKIGVKAAYQGYTWPELLSQIKNRKGQAFIWAWRADYPDAENFLQLFYSKNVSPGPNDANYKNPKFDRLYEKSLRLPDSPARTKIYKQMVSILVEDAPWIFLLHRLYYKLSHPWLKNYKLSQFDWNHPKYWRVDTAEKKKRLQ